VPAFGRKKSRNRVSSEKASGQQGRNIERGRKKTGWGATLNGPGTLCSLVGGHALGGGKGLSKKEEEREAKDDEPTGEGFNGTQKKK